MQGSRTHRLRLLRAEWVIIFGCCQCRAAQQSGCVPKGQLEQVGVAVQGGRVHCSGSTRIHQAGMEMPIMEAAATECWSVRGRGMRHGVGSLTASESDQSFKSLIKLRRACRSPVNASLQIRTGPGLSEPGFDGGSDYWSGCSPFVSSASSPFVRKLLPWMTIATP